MLWQPKSLRWHVGKKHLPQRGKPLPPGAPIRQWYKLLDAHTDPKETENSPPFAEFWPSGSDHTSCRLITMLQNHFFLQPGDTAALISTKQTVWGGNQPLIWDRQSEVWGCPAHGHPSSEGPCHTSPGALGGWMDGSNEASGQPSLLRRQLAASPGRKPAPSYPVCWHVCHTIQSSLATVNMHTGTASLTDLHYRLTPQGDSLGWLLRHGEVPLYHLCGSGDIPYPSNTLLRNNPGDSSGFADCFALEGHSLVNWAPLLPHHLAAPFRLPYPLITLVTLLSHTSHPNLSCRSSHLLLHTSCYQDWSLLVCYDNANKSTTHA